jgi:sterol desaturase/sphingolipid hydroxylase (fatty acid hydroxylase superfamily)
VRGSPPPHASPRPPVVHLLHPKAALLLEAPSFGRLCGEVLTGIVLYDLAFYPLHYAMHNLPFKPLRAIHGYHHRKGHTLNALETVQHSYADGFLQVVVNILVQQVSFFPGAGDKHPLSRILHNIIVTYLLTESHSGYRDLPFMTHRLWPEVFGGAERHEAHHHNGKVCYHQYFKYIDDAFGWSGRPADARLERSPQLPDTHAELHLHGDLSCEVEVSLSAAAEASSASAQ